MTRLIRLPEVQLAVGLSKSEIYRLISCGKFPRQISLGDRAVAWTAESIEAWVTARIEHHKKEGAGNEK